MFHSQLVEDGDTTAQGRRDGISERGHCDHLNRVVRQVPYLDGFSKEVCGAEIAQTPDHWILFPAGHLIPPIETPRLKYRWEMKYTIRLGTVAITEPANSGPHSVVWAPMK